MELPSQLNRELPVGSTVVVRNSHGAQAPMRVVAQMNVAQGIYTFGVEFLQGEAGENFWGITFPSLAGATTPLETRIRERFNPLFKLFRERHLTGAWLVPLGPAERDPRRSMGMA